MNKRMKTLLTAMFMCCTAILFAQQTQTVPTDPKVRIGKLENGLTYYIRQNALPEGQADFYIAQKVGSILEEESQRGLAHFLEHMCFNGTKHFPNNRLREYLENIGVKFGVNLNAYTAMDETVYNINNVPIKKVPEAVDSCLWILRDWSDGLTLGEEEIDKERGVIHEEWRTRMDARMRIYEKVLPVIYPNSQYAYRLPIGTMEVVDNFPYKDLRDYYEKWYRPDQQGIIVVGDFDADQMEAKIKAIFSDIEMPANAAERVYYPVHDNKEPIVAIATDKEQPYVMVEYIHKHDAVPDEAKSDINYMVLLYAKSMISQMFGDRFSEMIEQSANPPFMQAGAYDGNFFIAKTKDALSGYAICKEDGIDTALSSLVREIERARRYGFTEGEYARAKANYLRSYENAYNEREKTKNTDYAEEYVRHFIDNEPMPGIEAEYGIMNMIASQVPVAAINQLLQGMMSDSNLVITMYAPEKEGAAYPAKEHLLEIVAQVKAEDIAPYVDKVSNEPLISELPQPGKVVKTEEGIYDSKIYTLSNGVKVVVKPTTHKMDEIRMNAFSAGGNSLLPTEDIINIEVLNEVCELGGLGNFNTTDLMKVLAGKYLEITPYVSSLEEGLKGSCSPKDLETLLQIAYLMFTAPRMDDAAFESYKNRAKASLQNQELDPMTAFQDTLTVALYNNHPRAIKFTKEMVDQIDYARTMEMYGERFADGDDFTFMFVGNIDEATAVPLFEQYLGALPVKEGVEKFDAKINPTIRKGKYANNFERTMELPKSTVFLLYTGKGKYDARGKMIMSMFAQVMDMVYTESVREKEGGTYGVGVSGGINHYPQEEVRLQIVFDTDPERRARMIEVVKQGLDDFIKNGPNPEQLARVKEFMLKKYQENQKENGYWISQLKEYYWHGIDGVKGYEQMVNDITGKEIQKFVKKLVKQGNCIEVSINGKNN